MLASLKAAKALAALNEKTVVDGSIRGMVSKLPKDVVKVRVGYFPDCVIGVDRHQVEYNPVSIEVCRNEDPATINTSTANHFVVSFDRRDAERAISDLHKNHLNLHAIRRLLKKNGDFAARIKSPPQPKRNMAPMQAKTVEVAPAIKSPKLNRNLAATKSINVDVAPKIKSPPQSRRNNMAPTIQTKNVESVAYIKSPKLRRNMAGTRSMNVQVAASIKSPELKGNMVPETSMNVQVAATITPEPKRNMAPIQARNVEAASKSVETHNSNEFRRQNGSRHGNKWNGNRQEGARLRGPVQNRGDYSPPKTQDLRTVIDAVRKSSSTSVSQTNGSKEVKNNHRTSGDRQAPSENINTCATPSYNVDHQHVLRQTTFKAYHGSPTLPKDTRAKVDSFTKTASTLVSPTNINNEVVVYNNKSVEQRLPVEINTCATTPNNIDHQHVPGQTTTRVDAIIKTPSTLVSPTNIKKDVVIYKNKYVEQRPPLEIGTLVVASNKNGNEQVPRQNATKVGHEIITVPTVPNPQMQSMTPTIKTVTPPPWFSLNTIKVGYFDQKEVSITDVTDLFGRFGNIMRVEILKSDDPVVLTNNSNWVYYTLILYDQLRGADMALKAVRIEKDAEEQRQKVKYYLPVRRQPGQPPLSGCKLSTAELNALDSVHGRKSTDIKVAGSIDVSNKNTVVDSATINSTTANYFVVSFDRNDAEKAMRVLNENLKYPQNRMDQRKIAATKSVVETNNNELKRQKVGSDGIETNGTRQETAALKSCQDFTTNTTSKDVQSQLKNISVIEDRENELGTDNHPKREACDEVANTASTSMFVSEAIGNRIADQQPPVEATSTVSDVVADQNTPCQPTEKQEQTIIALPIETIPTTESPATPLDVNEWIDLKAVSSLLNVQGTGTQFPADVTLENPPQRDDGSSYVAPESEVVEGNDGCSIVVREAEAVEAKDVSSCVVKEAAVVVANDDGRYVARETEIIEAIHGVAKEAAEVDANGPIVKETEVVAANDASLIAEVGEIEMVNEELEILELDGVADAGKIMNVSEREMEVVELSSRMGDEEVNVVGTLVEEVARNDVLNGVVIEKEKVENSVKDDVVYEGAAGGVAIEDAEVEIVRDDAVNDAVGIIENSEDVICNDGLKEVVVVMEHADVEVVQDDALNQAVGIIENIDYVAENAEVEIVRDYRQAVGMIENAEEVVFDDVLNEEVVVMEHVEVANVVRDDTLNQAVGVIIQHAGDVVLNEVVPVMENAEVKIVRNDVLNQAVSMIENAEEVVRDDVLHEEVVAMENVVVAKVVRDKDASVVIQNPEKETLLVAPVTSENSAQGTKTTKNKKAKGGKKTKPKAKPSKSTKPPPTGFGMAALQVAAGVGLAILSSGNLSSVYYDVYSSFFKGFTTP
ncbi:hypothetical protein HDU76_000397 [Blyttiomyces sp. JEL0837]|nr:hypothetical protein HDU76_000397 [Blyttiomyces sp. JEL0837]